MASLLWLCSCGAPTEPVVNAHLPPVSCRVFRLDSTPGWGYDIIRDDQVFIHQPFIPAIEGHRTFSSGNDAQKTARYIISKINKGIVPPAVTVRELDSLKVLPEE
jgi:hypothetical protein